MKKEYDYFWYDHAALSKMQEKIIEEHIMNHDFEAFLQLYMWYQINPLNNPERWVFFPDTIAVFVSDDSGEIIRHENISVFDRENFNKITYVENEIGVGYSEEDMEHFYHTLAFAAKHISIQEDADPTDVD